MNTKQALLEIEKLPQKRIVIVGAPGSGKSSLGEMLAAHHGLPLIQADRYFWKNNGQHVSEEELKKLVQEKLDKTPIWIYEGHFKTCHTVVLKEATLVIEISKNFWLSFFDYALREIKRSDLNLKQKIDKILFVPKNHRRIMQTRQEALKNFKGKRIKV